MSRPQGSRDSCTADVVSSRGCCRHAHLPPPPPHLHPALTDRLHGVVLRVCLEYGRLRVRAAAESHLRKGQSRSCHARRLTSQLTVTGSVLGQLTHCQLTVSTHCDRMSVGTAGSLCQLTVSSHCDRVGARTAGSLSAHCVRVSAKTAHSLSAHCVSSLWQLIMTGSVLGQLAHYQLTVSPHCVRVSARTADSLSAHCVSSL